MSRLFALISILVGLVFLLTTFPAMLVVGVLAATGQSITFSAIFYVLGKVVTWTFLFLFIGFFLIGLGIYVHRANKKRY